MDVKLKEENADFQLETPVVTYSVCLPGTRVKGQERSYVINKVLLKQLELELAEAIDEQDESVYD